MTEPQKTSKTGLKSALRALLGTIIITPVIMIISVFTCPGTDPLCSSMTPLVGIIYAPIVFVVLWAIFHIYLTAKYSSE